LKQKSKEKDRLKMASNVDLDKVNDTLYQSIISRQLAMKEMMQCMTSFVCTSCPFVKISKYSSEYLIAVDRMKEKLFNLVWIIRDLYSDWPIECACLVKLEDPIYNTFKMTRYLFQFSVSAYKVNVNDEKEAIDLYEAIYKDAYKFHKMFINILPECHKHHPFLEEYCNWLNKCHLCWSIQVPFSSALDTDSSSDDDKKHEIEDKLQDIDVNNSV
jgi:hypothetical protein